MDIKTDKVVPIKKKSTKATPAKKVGRPRKPIETLSKTELDKIMPRIVKMRDEMQKRFGFKPTLVQTMEFCLHLAEPED